MSKETKTLNRESDSETLQEPGCNATSHRKDFSSLQIMALGFNVSNSWVAIATSFAVVVAAGGPVTLLYGVIISCIVYAAVATSLAELASIYPTAGGQYHFTALIAPKSISRSTSYVCGAIAAFSWVALCTAATILGAQALLALPQAFIDGYIAQPWHYFLVYQAINVVVLLFNLFGLKRMLWVHDVGFALTIVTFVVTVITCLALSEKQPSSFVWTQFENNTGWNDGICFFTGLVTPCFMYAGIDASLHLAEECAYPKKTVPRALMSTVLIGSVTGFVFSIAMCYSIVDLEAMLNTTVPIYELWMQATSSVPAATTFLVALFVILIFVTNAMQQTASHLIWALGRDDALVFSAHLSHVHPVLDVPVWGLIANACCVFVTGCLYLASTTAFNALINSSIILQMVSFAIPALLLMIRRRDENVLPKSRAFAVPKWLGWLCNLIVVLFSIIEVVFFNFPTFLPVSGSSMNYTCVVLAIMGAFITANWFLHARKHYMGPVIELHTE